MTLEDFTKRLSQLLADSIDLPAEDVLSELETQVYALREDVANKADE
jgi:hypothetical protein